MTQLEKAKRGEITPLMEEVARDEGLLVEFVREKVAEGRIVIFYNKKHSQLKPIAVGEGLRIKVNANVGVSSSDEGIDSTVQKVKKVFECGVDTVMDLSSSGDMDTIRKVVLKNSFRPVGSCPVYQVFGEAIRDQQSILDIPQEKFFEVIEKQAKDGISFMGLHCALTQLGLQKINKRLMSLVSKGGGLMSCWMRYHQKENPLFEGFDQILKILKKYDVVLDISDCLRPGCIYDANDEAHISEILVVSDLVQRAHSYGVSVITEGPGHMPLDQIESSVKIQKKLNYFAPLYMLGPLVVDVAVGYDHIAAAIGASVAGQAGADFLCTITPAEHLGLPNEKDLERGIYATRIAGLAADTARQQKSALEQNINLSRARHNLNWPLQAEYALSNKKIKNYLKSKTKGKSCSMCGECCPLKLIPKN
jgi:phosphomethylpyrimidine synthase